MSDWVATAEPSEDGKIWTMKVTNIQDESQIFSFQGQMVHGIAYPPWCPQSRWDNLNSRVSYKEFDIIVATYPKCGTTWIEQCVLLLLNRGSSENLNPGSKNTYIPGLPQMGKLWIEASIDQNPQVQFKNGAEFAPVTLEQFQDVPSPRLIKTHAPPHHVIGTEQMGVSHLPSGTKVIVVTRNPLDACVSSYYHAFNPFKSGWPFEAWAEAWLSGFTPHGSWFRWVIDWYQEKNNFPTKIHWIQYEDLQSDPHAVVRQLAQFLEIHAENEEEFEEIINLTVHGSSFESMKEKAPNSEHLRKGGSGDWENHFNPTLVERFGQKYREEMVGSGLVYSLGPGRGSFVE